MSSISYHHLIKHNTIEKLYSDPLWNQWIEDEIFIYELINNTSFHDFEKLPLKFQENKTIILAGIEKYFLFGKKLPSSVTKDTLFCMYCCSLDPKYASLFKELLQENRNLVIWYCETFSNSNVTIASYLPDIYKNDLNIAQLCISKNVYNFKYFSIEIRDSLTIYEQIPINKRVEIFLDTGETIKAQWDYAFEAVSHNHNLYHEISLELQKEPDFFLKLLNESNDKVILKYAHESIRDNEHCVWQATLINELNLPYASHRLLNSVSFAVQVISSLEKDQVANCFGYFGEHVRNHKLSCLEILGKLVDGNALDKIGPELKEDKEFIETAALQDSTQALNCCSKKLLEDSSFFISLYRLIDEKNEHKGRYDDDSEQSNLFSFITEKDSNSSDFLAQLYDSFGDLFITIIYNKIKHHDNPLVHFLNVCSQNNQGLKMAMDKISLKYKLQKELPNEHHDQKRSKI